MLSRCRRTAQLEINVSDECLIIQNDSLIFIDADLISMTFLLDVIHKTWCPSQIASQDVEGCSWWRFVVLLHLHVFLHQIRWNTGMFLSWWWMILQGLFDVIQDVCPMSIGSSEPGDVRILGSMDADVVSAAQINDWCHPPKVMHSTPCGVQHDAPCPWCARWMLQDVDPEECLWCPYTNCSPRCAGSSNLTYQRSVWCLHKLWWAFDSWSP